MAHCDAGDRSHPPHLILSIFIGIGINRDSLNAHLPRGLNHTASNFAAIGDEDFFNHF